MFRRRFFTEQFEERQGFGERTSMRSSLNARRNGNLRRAFFILPPGLLGIK
jgi:hypothetical protein